MTDGIDQPTWHTACLICGHPQLKPLPRYSHAHLVRCRQCGFTFAGRRPTDVELGDYYRHYGSAWYDSPITRERYEELLDSFEAYRRTNHILDVGCGAGFFLEQAKRRGWEVHGTEFGSHAIELGRAKGLGVVEAPRASEAFDPGQFDVVTAFEVVEHVRDPAAEAATISRVLRNGGLFYCTTPNFNAGARRLLGPRWIVIEYPEHLSFFTASTLRTWLGRFDLAATDIVSTGFSPTNLRKSVAQPAHRAPVGQCADEQLRAAAERSRLLRFGKNATNALLATLGAGDTLKARFERRTPEAGRGT